MGKSTVARAFEEMGVKTWNADNAVHEIYANDEDIKDQIVQKFGDVLDENNQIDRKKLGKIVLSDAVKLKQLEAIIHPTVARHRENFIKENQTRSLTYVILDIPLLFETGQQKNFDKIIVVNCSPETQKKRVLARPNMTEEKFEAIKRQQMDDQEKIAKADFVIDTEKSLDETYVDVQQIHKKLLKLAGEK